ncbi:MAG: cytochrome c3 family protein [Gemmatimonadota bacterium]
MGNRTTFVALAGCAVLVLTSLASCVDEKIVYRDRELFEEVPSAAANFVGYSDHDSKLTVCGNCHIEKQTDWAKTKHASAWAGLQESGAAQTFCEGCHTVSELGNPATEAGGYTATQDPRYEDVQCESCHGPGLDHVTNPTSANVPLAAATVGLDNTTGCGECHQDTHHPFVEQWEQSGHSQLIGFAAAREYCNTCHEGGAALKSWGINTNYLEKDDELFSQTCVVCHDPHADDNEAQLRFPIEGVSIQENLCSKCHDRRTEPDATSSHGLVPHAPETGLLEGDVGWFPPGLTINRGEIVASHGSEGNEKLCATCHVASQTVTDPETGDFLFKAVGHSFNAIPCYDEQGIPGAGDCGMTVDDRSFQGCTAAGCHTSETAAASALSSATTSLQFWAEELKNLLVQVDPNLDSSGGEIDATDGKFTIAEGAFFNLKLAEFGGAGRPDPKLAYASAAVHNPFLTEQLLIASIQTVKDTYGVALSSPDLVLERRIKPDGR